MFDGIIITEVVSMLFYTALGLGLLWISWRLFDLLTPFSVIKELEEDQNTAVAVVIAAIFVAMSIIIAAVILS